MIYVALLRGINVGGNNKVDMRVLVSTLEDEGFNFVSSYINTGNIFFSDNGKTRAQLVKSLESTIKKKFDLDIRVLLRDYKEIKKTMAELPEEWVNNKEMKTDVMFLWDDLAKTDIIKNLPTTDVDNIKDGHGAIIWNMNKADKYESGQRSLVGTTNYKRMTIRNANTARKILKIMNEMNEAEVSLMDKLAKNNAE